MKKLSLIILTMLAFVFMVNAQAPNKFKYQAVVRDAAGAIKASQSVDLKLAIRSGSASGTVVYSEEQNGIMTNAYGLISLNIGDGTAKTGDITTIDWSANSYYIVVEMKNGAVYDAMGNSQLLSVPYSLYSAKAGSAPGGTSYTAGTGIDIAGTTITNSSPNATHTGDATGSGALTVVAIQGRSVASNAPASGEVLKWDGSSWAPASDAGGTSYSAGTGISIAGSTITNTAPDQTVALTGSGATSISGTYPSFTISSTDNNTTYTAGSGLTLTGTTFSANSSSALWNAIQLQGYNVNNTVPTVGKILKWDGVNWTPSDDNDNNTTYSAGTGLTLTGTTFSANTTTASWNANQLQGTAVNSTAPTNGQVLKYNGANWAAAADNNDTYTAGNGLTLSASSFAVNGSNVVYLYPAVTYNSNTATLTVTEMGAYIVLSNSASATPYIHVPLNLPGTIANVAKKITSVSIDYYCANAASFITRTSLLCYKLGASTTMINDATDRTATAWTTYTITPTTTTFDRVPYIEFQVTFTNATHYVYIGNISVTLSD